ncbi:MAG: hypothetical protein JW863_19245 [Chitinispirillaceae bacterium]|nr:hypothetical protein [Chitinispirillaceae bacterium]
MRYTIAVSGINATDNPGPGTGIARSLRESGLDVRIIGLAYDTMEPGIYMDWIIDKSYILPYPSIDPSSYLERIRYIHEREQVDVIIPALDAELPLYITIESQLAEMGIRTFLPSMAAFRARGKDRLDDLAHKTGLFTPPTFVLTSGAEIDGAIAQLGFPLLIKGPFYEATVVTTRAQALAEFHHYAAKWGLPIIAQKFISGEEYNCIGLGDGSGGDMGHCAIKKMLITRLGKIWTNVSISNGEIFAIAETFVGALNWRGGYELELIREHKTGIYYLIEINPRFPAWVFMATGCGINLPLRLVQAVLGEPYETHSDYEAGKILMRYTDELVLDIGRLAAITTSAELAGGKHGKREHGVSHYRETVPITSN